MGDNEIETRLQDFAPHAVDEARARALLASRIDDRNRPRQIRSVSSRAAVVVAVLAVALVGVFAVSPPGQAVATWIKDFATPTSVGISDEQAPTSLIESCEQQVERNADSGCERFLEIQRLKEEGILKPGTYERFPPDDTKQDER